MHDEKHTIKPTVEAARKLSRWELALCQHPMLLLIKEDSLCAEREASWGGDFEHHLDRLEKNLASLERYPELRVCFDFAAVELELVAEHRPDLIAKMRDMARARRITLTNGTWSQPHLQCLGHESVYRQFEIGLATTKRLLGATVRTCASQEPMITQQLPQLLSAFGYETTTLTHFMWTLTFRTAHPLLGYRGRLYFFDDEPFTTWRALDGSGIPLYLADVGGPLHGGISDDGVFWEFQKDKLRGPALRINYPDMIAPDDDWIKAQTRNGTFVLLDHALLLRLREHPPKSEAALTPSFSTYAEGTGGSRLSILNRAAEVALRQARAAEVLGRITRRRRSGTFNEEIRTLLTCQHHDGYWPGGSELRAKAVAQLEALIERLRRRARHSLGQLHAKAETGACPQHVVVFNSLPRKRTDIARLARDGERGPPLIVVDDKGRTRPAQIVPSPAGGWEVWLPASFKGLGCISLNAQAATEEPKPQAVTHAWKFSNTYYTATVQPDLTLTRLRASGGGECLVGARAPANEIRGMTSEGAWVSTAASVPLDARRVRGPVADVAWARFELPAASLTLMGAFFHDLPWAEFTARFDFRKASYGDYWKDESKLNVRWPLRFDGTVRHEVPFGHVEALAPGRPMLASGWLDVSSPGCGLAYFQQGTWKHWLNERVLTNLLAWGTATNRWNSRVYGNMVYGKTFDLTLDGTHMYHWAVMPHAGDPFAAGVPDAARRYGEPLVAVVAPRQEAPFRGGDVLRIGPAHLEPVTVEWKAGKVRCLVFEREGRPAMPTACVLGKRKALHACALDGKTITRFRPFQIGWVELAVCGGGAS